MTPRGPSTTVRWHRHPERTIKILHIVDECTRASFADLVDHSIDGVACLDKIIGARGRDSAVTDPTFSGTLCRPGARDD